MASFQFRSLESASHFRILYLDAGAYEEQLSGSLVHHNLDEHPIYDCLSYVWGCPNLSHSVLVDGASFPVTANLYSALKRIRARRSNGQTAIWADGICINQNDISERNQQIGLMRRIYSECQTGLMYIGEAADGSELLPDFLNALRQSIVNSVENMNILVPLGFDGYAFPKAAHPGWKILRNVLRRPWFQRVWIIQEFALASQIKMICGQWEIPGTYLIVVFLLPIWAHSQGVPYTVIDNATRAAVWNHRVHLAVRANVRAATRMTVDRANGAYPTNPPVSFTARLSQPLIWLLDQSQLFLATDPRDKIYALIPLSSDSENSNLTMDYSKPRELVIAEVAQHLVRNGYGLSLLLSAGSLRFSNSPSSWYPDWTSSVTSPGPVIWPMRFKRMPGCQIILNSSTETITAIGSIVDIVQDPGALVCSDWLAGDRNKWIKEINTIIAEFQTYPTGKAVHEAVWRTLTADRSKEKQSPAPESYGNVYRLIQNITAGSDDFLSSSINFEEAINTIHCFDESLLKGHRFSTTAKKLFSMLPREAEVGDSVFFVKGDPEKVTFLIRKDPGLDQYRLIGQAYVHGIWSVLKLDDLEDIAITIY